MSFRFWTFILIFLFGLFISEDGIFAMEVNNNIQQVLKIRVYTYNPQSESYIVSQYGSAILIDKNRVITNAHVVVDEKTSKPTGLYELCLSLDYRSPPVCRTGARLVAYDPVADLALLESEKDITTVPVSLPWSPTIRTLSIGQSVVIYGYPTIGWETITRTEWKIAGYQSPVYKVDVSIDHGNSGWGAFDASWSLIGIPYAVSSDNGVIGYMISLETIDAFLKRKTPNYTSFGRQNLTRFYDFLSDIHNQMIQSGSIRGWGLYIRNPSDSWFRLAQSMFDNDKKLASWMFVDEYSRVSLYVSCTEDAGKMFGYEMDHQTFSGARGDASQYDFSEEFVGDQQQFYHVSIRPKDPKNDGTQEFVDTWYYTQHDSCYAQISSVNPIQDRKLIWKAEKILKNAKFRNKYILSQSQKNPYFSIAAIPDYVRSTLFLELNGEKKVNLDFLLTPTRSVDARIRSEQYFSLDDYFIKPFYNVDSYDGARTFSWLLDQFAQEVDNTGVRTVISKNMKRIIFTYKISRNDITINVFYPYQIEGKYFVWYWTKTFTGDVDSVNKIARFFSQIELPWSDIFP